MVFHSIAMNFHKHMISRKKQRNYFRQRWDNVFSHFDRFAKRTDAEHIHQIRVELKKINALLFLHENISGKLPKKTKQHARMMFRQAGAVRDAQVSSQLVRSHPGVPRSFFTEQRLTVATEAKILVRDVSDATDDLLLANANTWKKFRPIHFKDLRREIRKLIKKIHDYLYPRIKINRLHDARKEIKRLIYIAGIIKPADIVRLKINPKHYKTLEELIGKWHDVDFTLELIDEYLPATSASVRKLNRRSKQHIRKIRQAYAAMIK